MEREINPNFSLRWISSVSQVKEIAKGNTVGYGRSFIAEQDMKIAVVAVGYADGYRRSLGSGNSGVFINGKFCKTIGRVCMDMIMVDIQDMDVQEGDQVEIIGTFILSGICKSH